MTPLEPPIDPVQFRSFARLWLETNCPESLRDGTPPDDEMVWGGRRPVFQTADQKLWFDRMVARGWTAPSWPVEYGGGGLDPERHRILDEELSRLRARPPLSSFGLWMFGPTLLEFGTEAQKRAHLSKIARGEIRWCQGYSEPNAGSDLASLATRCEARDDHYLVNGSKIWTSYADRADWIFCLVRTDPSQKQGGISFLIFDMATPGVETRPIPLISGASPFCETFFTDVKVPKDQLIGQWNQGWTIAKRLLQFERSNINGFGAGVSERLETVAARAGGLIDGRLADPDLRERITSLNMQAQALQLTAERAAALSSAGRDPGALSSLLKAVVAGVNQDRCELLVEALGTDGLHWAGPHLDPDALSITRAWLRSKANSIEGGTTEVNHNVIAKRILGLG